MLSDDHLENSMLQAHNRCMRNHGEMKNDTVCGCFHCLSIFSAARLTEKDVIFEADGSETALCPFCGIDSIIAATADCPVTPDFLTVMKKRWF